MCQIRHVVTGSIQLIRVWQGRSYGPGNGQVAPYHYLVEEVDHYDVAALYQHSRALLL